ncbi:MULTISPECIES: biliverdin-producing heme oxygenase [unclassified Pseudoalteromonas]|uniref:biliverdin-producing heme oxygenase n=1 Tax=unclassified Pseudoalteromonas TaxID=194690 RepID=UPI0011098643|nr:MULTISPECIES: biliverdin-producing heme oxygenase [unclassified Pseudoalteromonas]TMN74789.1 hypothetical protein CWB85_00035 [Pseudoalteromonas sp. S1727]BDF93481.1 heme oxygenase [Pseudoalteromonas sp. KAN5]
MSSIAQENYPRMSQLKRTTAEVHDDLDQKIMVQSPFASKQNYADFLRFQYLLLNHVEPLYNSQQLAPFFADLASRNRCHAIALDLQDLGMQAHTATQQINLDNLTLAQAVGWLYVIEGSKLGAAMLAKEVTQLGLDADFGARFLAGPGNGRGSQWREFMQAVEALDLTSNDEQELYQGAKDAFATAHQLLNIIYQ